MKAVYVQWLDSNYEGAKAWYDKEETVDEANGSESKDAVCHTLGWLIGESDFSVTITTCECDTEVGAHTTIPKLAIIHREEIPLDKSIRRGVDE